MRRHIYSAFVFLLIQIHASASPMTASDFDFWTGQWNCFTNDTIIGENHVLKTLNSMVIEENFKTDGDGFVGKSWSVFDTATSVWRQTWVDNSGAYMNFTGDRDKDTLIFMENESVTIRGHKVYRRMIFYSIELNSFEWKWQSSIDRKEWKTNWHIHYQRKQTK